MVLEVNDFLSSDHCDSLVELSQPQFTKTTTLGKEIDGYRVAHGAWLLSKDDKVNLLRKMVSEYTSLPIENMEGTHIVKYEIGGEYKVHHDFFHPGESYYEKEVTNRGGQRTKTALIYLNDGFTGGETEFPQLNIRVTPLKGKLVVWDNLNPNGSLDYTSIHAGLPVISGIKYIAVIWIRENKFV
jgi:prolyl 4-hydroxylase